ncbi:MAG: hypothetical protein JW873_07065 [Candidatus Saganbacteria bacterium]|nr:hypothetical protein [Candidatus Saganbacteria bacterium]
MAASALYLKGNYSKRFYPLLIDKRVIASDPRLHATPGVRAQVRRAGDFIIDLTTEGVQTREQGIMPFPSIYIRLAHGHGNEGVRQIFSTEEELDRLGGPFDLAARVVSGAFFVYRGGLRGAEIMVSPAWHELLEPDWRQAQHVWVRDPVANPEPDPPGLPWRTIPYFLPVPGMVLKASFMENSQKIVRGEFFFRTVNGQARGFFRYNGTARTYLIRPDKITYLGDEQAGRASFELAKFRTMLGERPALTDYSFYKKCWGEQIQFGDKLLIFIQPADFQFLDREGVYFLRLVRHERDLYLFCHRDASSPRPLAWGCRFLTEDGQLPLSPFMTARRPEDNMPEFGIIANT